MKLLNEEVQHKEFGTGHITKQTDTIITVQFSDEYGIKKFQYPLAFETHLTIMNAQLQTEIDNKLWAIKSKIEIEKIQKAKEREEELIATMDQKKAAAKKATAAKKASAKQSKTK